MPIFWISPEFHNILIFVSHFKIDATVWIPNLTWLTWAVYFLDYGAKALIFKPHPIEGELQMFVTFVFPQIEQDNIERSTCPFLFFE